MQILSLEPSHAACACFKDAMAEVIGAIGHPEFNAKLFAKARRFIGAEYLTAFFSQPNARPRALIAEDVGNSGAARFLSERYISRYWKLDPANDPALLLGQGSHPWALRLRSQDISSAAYRNECYLAIHLAERFSLVDTRPAGTLRLDFYRGRKERFTNGVADKLSESANLLMSVLWRHYEACCTDDRGNVASRFRDRLRMSASKLSPRELDVCTLVASGVTSEGIALELGISLNTVLTYRKRAYARLNISSQNELMRIMLRDRSEADVEP